MSMKDHLELMLGNEKAESMLESEILFVYPAVSYDSLEVFFRAASSAATAAPLPAKMSRAVGDPAPNTSAPTRSAIAPTRSPSGLLPLPVPQVRPALKVTSPKAPRPKASYTTSPDPSYAMLADPPYSKSTDLSYTMLADPPYTTPSYMTPSPKALRRTRLPPKAYPRGPLALKPSSLPRLACCPILHAIFVGPKTFLLPPQLALFPHCSSAVPACKPSALVGWRAHGSDDFGPE
ncbi:hypothetical protein AXG93_4413s1260 [Marchantia polymorpha subsp. ruderalis]|uniref:Uncharacterized protein n=1 Tax=Marchantia polymorpha subsp. ruderalis TaxID=1480154 RepID=A0A176W389_MARPO|nr:hypothetical protein AXG93_4413s1260 [Marchantia polymorpha subsp. ruderalis]